MKSRIYILFAGLMLGWGLLLTRAAYLQVWPNSRLNALHQRQFQTVITLQSRRGLILDRNGRDLAMSTSADSVYADPKLIEAPRATARRLAKELGLSYQVIYSKIKDPKKRFVWISRLADAERVKKLRALDMKGISFVEEFKRIYPNESLLAPVLGAVGSEGNGLEGLELMFNEELRGNKKKISVRRDARGRPLVADGMIFADNPDGAEVKLTVDSEVQHILEEELKNATAEYDADQAFGVILDAQTSAILAMANTPTFDANQALRVTQDQRRNRSLTDAFEPGSTMKTFVVAAALREKILAPNTRYDTENGSFKVADRIIREADVHHKWKSLTASEILAYSSNIGTTKIAFQLQPEILRKALEDFGFGAKLGVDLPGEARGQLLPLPWRPHLLANISFGHGISVTPLQIANAYAAIANGGELKTPYIIKSIYDSENGTTKDTEPKTIRRILSPEEASQMRLMLAAVSAPGGTGVNAKVDGFPIAGKTGTAQKVRADGKGYLDKGYISSFAGFIPTNNPQFVIYVAVDHPKKNAFYGSQVAAPMFSRLAGYMARKAGLAPVLLSEKNLVPSNKTSYAPVKRMVSSTATAAEILQLPKAQKADTVPNLMNLTLREVLQRTQGQDLQLNIRGTGLVSEVLPAVGSPLEGENKRITIILK